MLTQDTDYKDKPLLGKRILVTRARPQVGEFVERIAQLGGEAVAFPVIQITRPKRQDLLDQAIRNLSQFDWIIFTSVNGVKFFFERLYELKGDVASISQVRLAAVGPKTAQKLREKGFFVEVLPSEYYAEALIEALRPLIKPGEHILLPRSNIARKVLPEELKKMGCHVTDVDAYDTRSNTENANDIIRQLSEGAIHVIAFTSSSQVTNFMEILKSADLDIDKLLKPVKLVAIGPITAQTGENLGISMDAIAKEYTIEGLVEVIQTLFA